MDGIALLLAGRRAVEVDVLPLAVLLLPDACFFEGGCGDAAVCIESLTDSDVGDHGAVTDDSNQRRADRRLLRQAAGFQVEIELVERHAPDDVSSTFWLKGCQLRIA